MSKNAIYAANLTKRYGELEAVRDVSFTVKLGEVVGFVGPNGAGKTTTISLLLGFIRASKGSIKLLGEYDITPESAHRSHRSIGYVAGDMALPDNLTGRQYLDFVAHRYGRDDAVRTRLDSRLNPVLGKRLRSLSRGNKQKIGLIAALQHDPELIIMDEPTTGLDPLMQETFLDIIREEAGRGATVFMSSHILSEVAKVCTRVMFMKRGRIVHDQAVSEIEKAAGKVIRIIANAAEVKTLLATMPVEISQISEEKGAVSFRYDGEMKAMLRWLSTKQFADITIEDRQLDDIFIDFYKDEGARV